MRGGRAPIPVDIGPAVEMFDSFPAGRRRSRCESRRRWHNAEIRTVFALYIRHCCCCFFFIRVGHPGQKMFASTFTPTLLLLRVVWQHFEPCRAAEISRNFPYERWKAPSLQPFFPSIKGPIDVLSRCHQKSHKEDQEKEVHLWPCK